MTSRRHTIDLPQKVADERKWDPLLLKFGQMECLHFQ